jgi:8-oxo-dGTP diphosphatase
LLIAVLLGPRTASVLDEACIQVTAGVLVEDGRVLVCQRRPGGHHPGKWEFPGGKVEPGESLAQGLHRELQEELGIEARVGRRLWETRHQYPGRPPFVLTFFLIPSYRGALANRAFADLRWAALGQLGGLDFLEGDRGFVEAVDRGEVRLDE